MASLSEERRLWELYLVTHDVALLPQASAAFAREKAAAAEAKAEAVERGWMAEAEAQTAAAVAASAAVVEAEKIYQRRMALFEVRHWHMQHPE